MTHGSDTYAWRSVTADGMSPRARLQRLEWLADLLDTALAVPGTRVRFGLDGLLGLAPGFGDAVTTGISLWIVYEAHRLGAPRGLVGRMVGNVMLDGLVGAVPILGDAFDLVWRANRRNVTLLREHLTRRGTL
jgi:hypothetical protein